MVERAYFCCAEVIGRDHTLADATEGMKSPVGAVMRERSIGGWKEEMEMKKGAN